MRLKYIIFLLTWLCIPPASGQKYIEIKMEEQFYDPQSRLLYVDLSLRHDERGSAYLGDSNFRIYYDSQNLRLDPSYDHVDLSSEEYSELHWHERIEHQSAIHIGELEFDDNLGFANLSIDLKDDLNGGLRLSKELGWKNIVQLRFEVLNDDLPCRAAWSLRGKTDKYATAFVEIMEWLGPNREQPFVIAEAKDLDHNIEVKNNHYDITIGPNPSVDFITIDFGLFASYTGEIMIHNSIGESVMKYEKEEGVGNLTLDTSGLSSSSYNLELFDEKNRRVFSESFVVTK